MPEKIRIPNLVAVNKRVDAAGNDAPDETGPVAKTWEGMVVENFGEWVQNGYKSGEWRIEVWSEDLEQTVTARVNEDRKMGDMVEFKLDVVVSSDQPTFTRGPPITLGRLTTSAQFKRMRNKGPAHNPQEGEWVDNPEFGKVKPCGTKEPESQ